MDDQGILYIDENENKCAREICKRVPQWLNEVLPCSTHLSLSIGSAFVPTNTKPKLVVVKAGTQTNLEEVVKCIKGMWPTVPLMNLFCKVNNNLYNEKKILRELDDFLFCPFSKPDLQLRAEKLIQREFMVLKDKGEEPDAEVDLTRYGIIGRSQQLGKIFRTIHAISHTSSTVMIYGETGTGKELIARAIHYKSQRTAKPFIPLNCGALPEQLLESELFGHQKGAFTGSTYHHKGLLGEAEGGTLFLDEINSLTLSSQVKILRFLQNKEYRSLGSSKTSVANVRVLAASNSNLKTLVEEGRFREDLYYRLHNLTVRLPPLRERVEDIPMLVDHFLCLNAAELGKEKVTITDDALRNLLFYSWPGNIRQLESAIHKAVICCASSHLDVGDFEFDLQDKESTCHHSFKHTKSQFIREMERTYIIKLLSTHGGNVSHAARAAGKDRRSFQRLLHKYGIDPNRFRLVTKFPM